MADRAGTLIDRLVATRDVAFAPPPFDGRVAQEVLGPSGGLLTPHRRLLERANGAYLYGGALHLFGACESPPWHSLRAWNAPTTWRDAFGEMTSGLVFFAEDAFGDQFAYTGTAGEVVCFEAEVGRVSQAAPTFVDWLEIVLDQPAAILPKDYIDRERAEGKRLAPGSQLFAWPPFATVESKEGLSVGHVDAVEAMRFRGEFASHIRKHPDGTRLQIQFED